jgi:hypothetical protein
MGCARTTPRQRGDHHRPAVGYQGVVFHPQLLRMELAINDCARKKRICLAA